MQKIRWYQKIQFQIPLIVFLITLIPAAAFSAYNISTSRQTQLQAAKTSMEERLYETSLLMQDLMQGSEAAGKNLTDNIAFLNLMKRYQENPQDEQARSSLLLSLGQATWPYSSIECMYLITKDAPYILSSDPEMKLMDTDGMGLILYQTWLNTMREQTSWARFQEEQNQSTKIAYWRQIQLSGESASSSLVCVLKNEYLSNAISGLFNHKDSVNVIGSYQGRILYGDTSAISLGSSLEKHPLFHQAYYDSKNSNSYVATISGVKWLVTYYNSLEDGWKYISAIPEQRIYSGFGNKKILYILIASGLVGILFGSVVLNALVSRPLSKLQKKMELMEKGQLDPLDLSVSNNEIGMVLQAYNRMILRLKKLIDEMYVQQLLRKQAELSSLQAQMDEHFLYNTLNTIYCTASEEKANITATMVLKLSQYFRLSLSEGQDKIHLNEILEMIRAYIQIQQMRYGSSLKCTIDTFAEIENYISLKQLYQPIIENAVIHGFEKKPGEHQLYISFCRTKDRLRFTVKDDGVGMSKERCCEVTAKLEAFDQFHGKGYALRNIQEQIRITYGQDYGITIDSQLGQGTCVVLEVPLERGKIWNEIIQ